MQAVFFPTKANEYPLSNKEEISRYEADQKRITDLQDPLKNQLTELEKPYQRKADRGKEEQAGRLCPACLKDSAGEAHGRPAAQCRAGGKDAHYRTAPVLAALNRRGSGAKHKGITQQIKDLDGQRPEALTDRDGGDRSRSARRRLRTSCIAVVPGSHGSSMKPGVLSVASQRRMEFSRSACRCEIKLAPATDSLPGSPRCDNPLTARVMVNRIWQHHFGEGIVRTPSNFGKMGEAPTHPELLDWLATEFMQSGWSIKAMHRLMMNSETYQMIERRHRGERRNRSREPLPVAHAAAAAGSRDHPRFDARGRRES